MPQGRDRWIAIGVVVGAVLLIAVFTIAGDYHSTSGSSSAADTSDAWVHVLTSMQGPAHDALYAAQAGNTQGVLTARTKLAADCDGAKGLSAAGSARGQTAEQAVRQACGDYGFPLP